MDPAFPVSLMLPRREAGQESEPTWESVGMTLGFLLKHPASSMGGADSFGEPGAPTLKVGRTHNPPSSGHRWLDTQYESTYLL